MKKTDIEKIYSEVKNALEKFLGRFSEAEKEEFYNYIEQTLDYRGLIGDIWYKFPDIFRKQFEDHTSEYYGCAPKVFDVGGGHKVYFFETTRGFTYYEVYLDTKPKPSITYGYDFDVSRSADSLHGFDIKDISSVYLIGDEIYINVKGGKTLRINDTRCDVFTYVFELSGEKALNIRSEENKDKTKNEGRSFFAELLGSEFGPYQEIRDLNGKLVSDSSNPCFELPDKGIIGFIGKNNDGKYEVVQYSGKVEVFNTETEANAYLLGLHQKPVN